MRQFYSAKQLAKVKHSSDIPARIYTKNSILLLILDIN